VTDDFNTEPLTSAIEWSMQDAGQILDEPPAGLCRGMVRQAIEELTAYAATEPAYQVKEGLSYSNPRPTYCAPCRGIAEVLHVLVDLLVLLVNEEAEEEEPVTLEVTRREARTLWNALSGEPFEDPNRTLTFKVEGAIG